MIKDTIIYNYMDNINTNIKNILTDDLIKKLSADTAGLIVKIRSWLSGEVPLSAMYPCVPIFKDSGVKINIDDIIRHIFVTAQSFDCSRNTNELQLSAQLKRIGRYLQGSIALKDV